MDAVEALAEAGRKLLAADPGRFKRVLALARAYVAAYERADEPEDILAARLDEIRGAKPRGSA